MQTLSTADGVENDVDLRPMIVKFRLNELKIILKSAGIKWGVEGEPDQLTADHARMLIQANSVDVTKYVAYDNKGASYFVLPNAKKGEEVMEMTKKAEVDDANKSKPTPEHLELQALRKENDENKSLLKKLMGKDKKASPKKAK